MLDDDQGNQKELISLIIYISKKLSYPTTLQDFIHQEAQVGNVITRNNVEGVIKQVE